MITHLSLCFSGNCYQLYSYSVPSLSLLSSLVVSNADFIFFFSKFLPPFSITTSVKSGKQYSCILWCLKGLSDSGWLFSESTRCWLWCWRPSGNFWPFSTLFPWLRHSSPPPQFFCYNSLWTCVANLYHFKVYSHSLLLSFRGLFLTQAWLAVQPHRVVPGGGRAVGRAGLSFPSWPCYHSHPVTTSC